MGERMGVCVCVSLGGCAGPGGSCLLRKWALSSDWSTHRKRTIPMLVATTMAAKLTRKVKRGRVGGGAPATGSSAPGRGKWL